MAEAPSSPVSGSEAPGAAGEPAGISAKPARRSNAEQMARRQREISVSEFFAKNRHLLGFDNPRKALLTTVKEAVDNALDACEEAGILPTIHVRLTATGEDRYRVLVRDNGPGIVAKNIQNVFGKLLYGSKFHRLRMSRGQQGIGISAAGMYGLMTTGKSVVIVSRTSPRKPAYYCELQIDTRRNEAELIKAHDCSDEELACHVRLTQDETFDHGTQVEIELKAAYIKGRQSVDAYMEQTAIANPHAQFVYTAPGAEPVLYPRGVRELPPEPTEIKPHPYGTELGQLLKLLKDSDHAYLSTFLQEAFCRVSPQAAGEIIKLAKLARSDTPRMLNHQQVERLHKAIRETRLPPPPTDCLVPIGTRAILAGLLKEIKADFYTAVERKPTVYRGNPFLVEVGLAFAGELGQFVGRDDVVLVDEDLVDKTRRKRKGAEEDTNTGPAQARLIRFANRVPLLYQQGACCTFKSVVETKWSNYGITQGRGALPAAPLIILVHVASVWVPFTSESKEAIADYDEIRREIKLALQEAGRKLSVFINQRNRMRREADRRAVFHRYIAEVAAAATRLDPSIDEKALLQQLQELARAKTEVADTQFDADGRVIRPASPAAGGLAALDAVIPPDLQVLEEDASVVVRRADPAATSPATAKDPSSTTPDAPDPTEAGAHEDADAVSAVHTKPGRPAAKPTRPTPTAKAAAKARPRRGGRKSTDSAGEGEAQLFD